MGTIKECDCCKKEFPLPCSMKEYKLKISNKFYCCWKCYSKTFDDQFKASTVSISTKLGYSRGRVVDKGYERHGSR